MDTLFLHEGHNNSSCFKKYDLTSNMNPLRFCIKIQDDAEDELFQTYRTTCFEGNRISIFKIKHYKRNDIFLEKRLKDNLVFINALLILLKIDFYQEIQGAKKH